MIDYSLEQVGREIARMGKGDWDEEKKILRCQVKDMKTAKRNLKAKGIARPGFSFSDHLKDTITPWGKAYSVLTLIEGQMHFAHTPSHGGLWINEDLRKQLPKWYKSYAGGKQWHEEDVDSALVLQHFGLLSLVTEPLTVEVTQQDIDMGKETRREWSGRKLGEPYFDGGTLGGPIEPAYQRASGTTDEIISTERCIQVVPGCWKYSQAPDEVRDFLRAFDNGEPVKPFTFTIQPYVLYHDAIPTGEIGYRGSQLQLI